jgi:hypothetical protein
MTEGSREQRQVERYLEGIDARLDAPGRACAEILDELRDGLHAAVERRLAAGVAPDVAASDAIREFGPPDVVAAALEADLLAARARAIARRMFTTGPLVGLLWIATLAPPFLTGPGVPAAATIAVAVVLLAAATSLTAATLTLQGPRLVALRQVAWFERMTPTTIAIATTATTFIDVAALTVLIVTLSAHVMPPSAAAVAAGAAAASIIRLPLTARAASRSWRHRTRCSV